MRLYAAILLPALFLEGSAFGQYVTGPRGGCYTITRSGAKRYVDRSLCQQSLPGTPANSRVVGASSNEQPKVLYIRLTDDQGRCFELYKDWSWAIVDSIRCDSPGASAPSHGVAVPPVNAGRPVESSQTGSSTNTGSGQGTIPQYMTGPRGGCYTVTPNGRKKYVPRSNCK